MRIGEWIVLRGFVHVDAIALHYARDQEILPRPPAPARGGADDAAQGLLRQQVLQRDGGRHARSIKRWVARHAGRKTTAAPHAKDQGEMQASWCPPVLPFTLSSLTGRAATDLLVND